MSKILQILRLQCQISKVFSRSLEQFLLTVSQNNLGNKILLLISKCDFVISFRNDFVHIVTRQVDNNRAVLGKVW